MKLSEKWLREWINPKVDANKLANQLTMAGLETTVYPIAKEFNGVVIGEILDAKPHPNAKRLSVCQVKAAAKKILTIVCGAKNVRPGLKVAVALPGAVLPADLKIKKVKLRGIESCGMICSSSELGLTKSSTGIFELPQDAPVSKDLYEYLKLSDNIIEVNITPNRGDCLNIAGIAREVSAINKCTGKFPPIKDVSPAITDILPVQISAKSGCPRYIGRVIRSIDNSVKTPIWMKEKLRRSDINPISPVVDVANYVMLELGQPLHVFDLAKLSKGIQVRYAKARESITLLNGQHLKLDEQALIIADNQKAIALAGIMGGSDSAVNESTRDIFIESAYFDAVIIGSCARRYELQTDSSYRFERGVDFNLQLTAIQYATKLLLDIMGGKVGPIIKVADKKHLPKTIIVKLRKARIKRILGISIADNQVEEILQRLGMLLNKEQQNWLITIPSYRFDIKSEIDLLEELARIYGYGRIPSCKPSAQLTTTPASESKLTLHRIRLLLADRGYHEAITYSFVDPKLQSLLCPQHKTLTLKNPISLDLSVMRSSLWPGLMKAMLYNLHRQQTRIRLFETGLCFRKHNKKLQQSLFLGGVVTGDVYAMQWGITKRETDFFDVKGDLQNLLKLTGFEHEISLTKEPHPALHPGHCAKIRYNQQTIGYLGELHPQIKQQLDINTAIYLFEIELTNIQNILIRKFTPISKFPMIFRDIAIIIDENIPIQQVREKIFEISNKLLRNVQIFDIYQGKGIEKGKKSVALNLIFQDNLRTLKDKEVDDFIEQIVQMLKQQFKAQLRS
jgi:phenylalanyl-tRNA synthetase beta chain